MGRSLILAVLVAGVTVATTGPSSAQPRDVCMDQVHYMQMQSDYESMSDFYWDRLVAWWNPDFYIDANAGVDHYLVALDTGTIDVAGQGAWTAGVDDATANFNRNWASYLNFMENTVMC